MDLAHSPFHFADTNDVYVWRYTLLVVNDRKEEEEHSHSETINSADLNSR